jgi:hypothetical protein
MDGRLGERPRSCDYVYSKVRDAAMAGLFVCTLYTVMQNGTATERSDTLAFATDPYMKDVIKNLPDSMSYEEKIQAIEFNYNKPYSQLHLWDVFGIVPKLTQLEAFRVITAKYPDIKAFETGRPKDGTPQWFAQGDDREKLYKFSLQLTVRPPGDPDEPPPPCPAGVRLRCCCHAYAAHHASRSRLAVRRRTWSTSCSNVAPTAARPATRSGWRR